MTLGFNLFDKAELSSKSIANRSRKSTFCSSNVPARYAALAACRFASLRIGCNGVVAPHRDHNCLGERVNVHVRLVAADLTRRGSESPHPTAG